MINKSEDVEVSVKNKPEWIKFEEESKKRIKLISYIIPIVQNENNPFVQIKIFDILGREVPNLINKEQKASYHKIEWSASNFSNGMYIYQKTVKFSMERVKFKGRK